MATKQATQIEREKAADMKDPLSGGKLGKPIPENIAIDLDQNKSDIVRWARGGAITLQRAGPFDSAEVRSAPEEQENWLSIFSK